MVKELLVILIASSLVNNVVLSQFLGLCPFLGVSKKTNTATGMGVAVIFVITLASAVAGAIYQYILLPLDITYLQTIVFILVIAALVQFVEMFLKKFIPALYQSLGVYLPLITTNCAILGVAEIVLVDELTAVVSGVAAGTLMNLGFALLYALFAGVGFTLAMVLMGGVRERMEKLPVAKCMKGFPITMVAASFMAMAFYVFTLIA